MIANIASDDALILSHRANPAGLNFRERQVRFLDGSHHRLDSSILPQYARAKLNFLEALETEVDEGSNFCWRVRA